MGQVVVVAGMMNSRTSTVQLRPDSCDETERTHLRGTPLHHLGIGAVAAASALASVAVNGSLQLARRAETTLLALVGVQVLHVSVDKVKCVVSEFTWETELFISEYRRRERNTESKL